jgi:hypothetical protein
MTASSETARQAVQMAEDGSCAGDRLSGDDPGDVVSR